MNFEDQEGESWAAIPSLPGFEASDFGQIRRGDTVLRQHLQLPDDKTVSLYPFVVLRVENGIRHRRKVYQMVAEAFHGPKPEGMVCRHLNGVHADSRPGNLQYGTQKQNQQDRVDMKERQRQASRDKIARQKQKTD
jgi:hypothetical protein